MYNAVVVIQQMYHYGHLLMANTVYIDVHTQEQENYSNQQLVNTHFSTLFLSLFSSNEFFTVSSSSKMFTRAQNNLWLNNI